MKAFYTGPAVNADLLVVMLEKHGIQAKLEPVSQEPAEDDDEFNRETNVFVPEADYERAYQLFYADREDEL